MSSLPTRHIDLRIGDRLVLDGGRIEVEAEKKSGQLVRLKVSALHEVEIKQVSGNDIPAMRAITGT